MFFIRAMMSGYASRCSPQSDGELALPRISSPRCRCPQHPGLRAWRQKRSRSRRTDVEERSVLIKAELLPCRRKPPAPRSANRLPALKEDVPSQHTPKSAISASPGRKNPEKGETNYGGKFELCMVDLERFSVALSTLPVCGTSTSGHGRHRLPRAAGRRATRSRTRNLEQANEGSSMEPMNPLGCSRRLPDHHPTPARGSASPASETRPRDPQASGHDRRHHPPADGRRRFRPGPETRQRRDGDPHDGDSCAHQARCPARVHRKFVLGP